MDNVTITRLQKVDTTMLLTLEKLERQNMKKAAVDRYTLRLAANAGAIWLLEENGIAMGACVALGNLGHGDVIELFSFHLSPVLRGRGLGDLFWGRVMADIDAEGFILSRLTVKPDNQTAIAIYQKHGFVISKQARDYYGPGEHRLVMERAVK